MLAGFGCLLRMGKLHMLAFPLQTIINNNMKTTCDCSCIARQNAGNSGMLPQAAQTALLQTGRRGSITEIKNAHPSILIALTAPFSREM